MRKQAINIQDIYRQKTYIDKQYADKYLAQQEGFRTTTSSESNQIWNPKQTPEVTLLRTLNSKEDPNIQKKDVLIPNINRSSYVSENIYESLD